MGEQGGKRRDLGRTAIALATKNKQSVDFAGIGSDTSRHN
jgi:hypothetical protein